MRPSFAAVCGLCLLAAACSSPAGGPPPPDDRADLRGAIERMDPPGLVLQGVGPERLFHQGEGGLVSLTWEGDDGPEAIPLYNAWLKVLVTLVDELQRLGLEAHADRGLLVSARDRLATGLRGLDDAELNSFLGHFEAHREFRDALLWDRDLKIEWLAEARLLRLLRGALPAERRAASPDGEEIMERYAARGDEPARLSLTVRVRDVEMRVDSGLFSASRHARFRAEVVVSDLDARRTLLAREYDVETGEPGSGLRREEGRTIYEQAPGEDPLERAMRMVVRAVVRDLLPHIPELDEGDPADAAWMIGSA